jgi:hypothetical protein
MAKLTLLTTTGTVHQTGGLNWGSNPNNHTNPLDAYIPIHIGSVRRYAPLFSPKGAAQTVQTLTWDDGTVIQVLFEGSQTDSQTGLVYPKQIASTPNKNTLGRYFRMRMGLSATHRITLQDLQNYGRTNIDLISTGLNQYNADFHV